MITRLAFTLTLVAASAGSIRAATAADERGLKPGDKAPAFTLKDQHGRERSLKSLLKQGNVALVFYRSADW